MKHTWKLLQVLGQNAFAHLSKLASGNRLVLGFGKMHFALDLSQI